MMFLESPDLGDSKEVWEAWLAELHTKNQRDESVKFAVKRAQKIISEMEIFEAQQPQLAYA